MVHNSNSHKKGIYGFGIVSRILFYLISNLKQSKLIEVHLDQTKQNTINTTWQV